MDPTQDALTFIASVVIGVIFLVNFFRWVARDSEAKKRIRDTSDSVIISKDTLIKLMSAASGK